MSGRGDSQYQEGQWASLLVHFIEDRNGRALVRLPNGSKTSVDYDALRPAEAHRSIRPPSARRSSDDQIPGPFRDVFHLIHTNGFVIDEDPAVEARLNTYALAFGSEAAKTVSVEQMTGFLREAYDLLAAAAQTIEATGLRFYSWFDEMAGQLRVSVSSAADLPFGATIQLTSDPAVIARQFLQSDYLDGIPWSELSETDDEEDGEPLTETEPLDVFAADLI